MSWEAGESWEQAGSELGDWIELGASWERAGVSWETG